MDVRTRIREAGLRLFAAHGYRATTIGMIEREASLAPRAGTFYRHFGSKQELFDECVRSFEAVLASAFEPAAPAAEVGTRAELLAIARRMLTVAREQRTIRRLIRQNITEQPGLLTRLNTINRSVFRDRLSRWVARRLPAAATSEDAAVMASLVFGPILYQILQDDIGAFAFGLDEERFLDGWSAHWAAALGEPVA